MKRLAVEVPGDAVGIPFDPVGVEFVSEFLAIWQRGRTNDSAAPGIARTVDVPVERRRFLADVLHDVDLAVVGPPNGPVVVAHHPERRPDSLSLRDLDSRFDLSVLRIELVFRGELRGGVGAWAVPAGVAQSVVLRGDGQVAVAGQCRVLPGIGVVLQFVVTPAWGAVVSEAADVVPPLARIGR